MSATVRPDRTTDWIQTYSGRQFWPLEPRAEEVEIADIAHALSNMCRFTGHVKEFYSVAQHSVLVARIVPDELKLWALLHDASEAYIHDLPRPLKRSSPFGDLYKQHETRLMDVVCERFGLPIGGGHRWDSHSGMPYVVKEADNILLMTEQRDLMGRQVKPWADQAQPLPETIRGWSPKSAKQLFLSAFVRYSA